MFSLKGLVRGLLTLLAGFLLFYLGRLNWVVQHQIKIRESDRTELRSRVYGQLQFLKQALHRGAGVEMQGYYPEGFVFIQVLYGLSWCDWLAGLPSDDLRFTEGLAEIDWTLAELTSEYARRIFPADLPLAHGVFYRGWTNYLRAQRLRLLSPAQRDSSSVAEFQYHCQAIARALEASESPYLESYHGAVWPADNVVALAALGQHDRLFPPRYERLRRDWLDRVQSRLDPASGLIPHSAQPLSGHPREGARGSSQSLMIDFLHEIDPGFGRAQFERYRTQFLEERLGLPGLREYPRGTYGAGDIDSGPVLWDIGGAASIVGMRVMARYGEGEVYRGLAAAVEGFGMGRWWGTERMYLGNGLPMADAFIAWGKVAALSAEAELWEREWRQPWALVGLSVGLGLVLLVGLWGLWRPYWKRKVDK